MPDSPPIDPDPVRVLDAGPVRRWRPSQLLALVALVAVAAGGLWVALGDPLAGRAGRAPPPPAADNLLGTAWSFETTGQGGPEDVWVADETAPAGFAFGTQGVISGEAAARSLAGPEDWARLLTRQAWPIDAHVAAVELSATSGADDLSLLVRFEGDDRPPLDVVVASGRGALVGRAVPPPGARRVRAGIGCLGPGTVDDVVLHLLEGERPERGRALGVYTVLAGEPPGLTVLRGESLALRVGGPSVRGPEGGRRPAAAGWLPGAGELVAASGVRVGVRREVTEEGRQLVLRTILDRLPADATVVRAGVVAGALAGQPLGVRSARGYERFAGDLHVEGVDALVLGRSQDRLVLEMDGAFTLTATHEEDGTVALLIERGGAGAERQALRVQAEFTEERVAAAQLRDGALAHEAAGELGAALADLETLLTSFPYDDQVLADALAARARLEAGMQARLDALDADLEDALFLGSASRCREVRSLALEAAETFAGCAAEARFRERAARVEERAANLLAEDLARRRHRVEAVAASFREDGRYPLVTAELEDYLARFLQPLDAGSAP